MEPRYINSQKLTGHYDNKMVACSFHQKFDTFTTETILRLFNEPNLGS